MAVYSLDLQVKTRGENDIIDLTPQVSEIIDGSPIENGIVVVFCVGSTGAITTVEYEPGLMKDIPNALEKIAPSNINYDHHDTWGCDNGRSHVRASIIGPSITVPFVSRRMFLGQWQQIVFIELDTRPRERTVIVQVLGE
ncbi:MAG: secondary thiamine-phosphate synthase enzyme YjbQ [Candidatus Altiarchaeota archaeon]|nr:secondary thiamine-phosphate synthase enzyme YjbQ [Candidatus Altiarchaeota archaeon]